MSTIKEGVQPQLERNVKFGEHFHIFASDHIMKGERGGFNTVVMLEIYEGTKIPFRFATGEGSNFRDMNGSTLKTLAFTPFTSKDGYQINDKTLTLEGREQYCDKIMENITIKGSGFYDSGINIDVLKNPDALSIKSTSIVPTEMRDKVKALRVRLRFPVDSSLKALEASPCTFDLKQGKIKFSLFYPTETGPLPSDDETAEHLADYPYGLDILLPAQLEELSKIKGEFVLTNGSSPQEESIGK